MTLPSTSKTDYGVVDKAIAPNQPGRIRFQGTYWKAELAYPDCRRVEVGEEVQVVGMRGITRLVVPEGYVPSVLPQKAVGNPCDGERSPFRWVQKFSFMLAITLG